MFRPKNKEHFNNVLQWIPIESIKNGINLKTHQNIQVLEVKPQNFKLLSENEQYNILELYGKLLKQSNIEIQIVVVPFQSDVKDHLLSVQKYACNNDLLNEMASHYIDFVRNIVGDKHTITRRFFLIIKTDKNIDENIAIIIDGLKSCGNDTFLCSDEKINEVLKVYFRKSVVEISNKHDVRDLCPTLLDTTNPKYIVMDDYYIASLFINNYHSEMEGGFLDKLISSDVDFILSMFYEKKNTYETIKELTGVIGNSGANIKVSGGNQIDIDLMKGSYENAKYIKKQLQIENDELYDLNIYLIIYANSIEELTNSIRKIESLVIASGLGARRGIFRQEEIFNSCMPIGYNGKDIKRICKRNVLTSGLVSTYPFLSNALYDKEGVLIRSQCLK